MDELCIIATDLVPQNTSRKEGGVMPIIKVWCLPLTSESTLEKLRGGIKVAVLSVKELGLENPEEITVLFPSAMMSYEFGKEIIVEVTALFEKPERTPKVRHGLAVKLAKMVSTFFPKAKIECFIHPFNPEQGFCALPPADS